ncbi:MAG: MTH1187 family thiamine-binding protein [Planctomycetes bacterium]|nr:MTH1187 family thiamine-binding protein [Planctomycetota bacterium]
MSVLVEFSITPIGKGESVSKYVKKAVQVVKKSRLNYYLCPMGTCIEGKNWDEVFDVIKKCYRALEKDCNRLSISIKVDSRKGRSGAIEHKIKSIT